MGLEGITGETNVRGIALRPSSSITKSWKEDNCLFSEWHVSERCYCHEMERLGGSRNVGEGDASEPARESKHEQNLGVHVDKIAIACVRCVVCLRVGKVVDPWARVSNCSSPNRWSYAFVDTFRCWDASEHPRI